MREAEARDKEFQELIAKIQEDGKES